MEQRCWSSSTTRSFGKAPEGRMPSPSMGLSGFVRTTLVYRSNSGPASPSRGNADMHQVAGPEERNPNNVITLTDPRFYSCSTEVHFCGKCVYRELA